MRGPPGSVESLIKLSWQIPGIGMGLSIVRGIVEARRGQIGAAIRPGIDAAFRFALPRAVPD